MPNPHAATIAKVANAHGAVEFAADWMASGSTSSPSRVSAPITSETPTTSSTRGGALAANALRDAGADVIASA